MVAFKKHLEKPVRTLAGFFVSYFSITNHVPKSVILQDFD